MIEKVIENKLILKTKKSGGLCVKFYPAFFAGFPDRIVLLPEGKMLFVELKAPGKKPSKIQRAVIAKLQGLGFRVEVCDTIEKVEALWG